MKNFEIWDKVRTPDPKYTKEFNRGGGFKGTATNTQYIIQQATDVFGPNGIGWGLEITQEQYVDGCWIDDRNRETIHTIRGYVWYMLDGAKYQTSEQYGQTTFVGKNKYGPYTDEEAPKKSITDMMLKCLSLLGFSADIFMGLWDDNKYVSDVRKKFGEKETPASVPGQSSGKSKPPYQNPQNNAPSPTQDAVNANFDALVDKWEKEADANDDTLDKLKAWYKKNEAKIAALPVPVKDKVNAYVRQLKDALSAPATWTCPMGGEKIKEDCYACERVADCEVAQAAGVK